MGLYDLTAETLDGESQSFRDYAGQVLLIVNVASHCGFTPQYIGLEALWQRYRDRGFTVLGFPCNQFGAQEPGDAAQIREFCSSRYPITFPLFAKIEVNGPNTHPVYAYLKAAAPGILGSQAIKWNFTKFLLDRQGHFIQRFGSVDTPKSLAADIEALL